MKITEKTRHLISDNIPEGVNELDLESVTCIPHPVAFEMDKESIIMNEVKSMDFVRKCLSRKKVKVLNAIGIVLASILILFLVF